MRNSPITSQMFTGKSVEIARPLDVGERGKNFSSSIKEIRASKTSTLDIGLLRSFRGGRGPRRSVERPDGRSGCRSVVEFEKLTDREGMI